MIHFIYPVDETTEFLLEIPSNITAKLGRDSVRIIKVEPNDESYQKSLIEISKIPERSFVVFMGHGQADKLWGAESQSFSKKSFITKAQSKVFSDKYLFLLSCDSNEFLKGTFSFSKIINSVGFGSLPTEMIEVRNSKRLTQQGVNETVVKRYKETIVELVSSSFIEAVNKNLSFGQMSVNFTLTLNRKISQVILDDIKNDENRILSDLLFQMKSEMIFI